MHSPQRTHIFRNMFSGRDPGGRINLFGDSFEAGSILQVRAEIAPAPADIKNPLLVRLSCGNVLDNGSDETLKDIAA